MKRFVTVVDESDDGFTPLAGEKVTVMCVNYFYYGTLAGANKDFIVLEDPYIIYETGNWKDAKYQDWQKMPTKELRIRTAAIESYGILKTPPVDTK